MNDLITKLILIYFENYNDEYLMSELKNITNYSNSQLLMHLNYLLDKGYLEKSNSIIKLSSSGIIYLKSEGIYGVKLTDLQQDTVTLNFIDDKFSFDTIYIPINFKP